MYLAEVSISQSIYVVLYRKGKKVSVHPNIGGVGFRFHALILLQACILQVYLADFQEPSQEGTDEK